MMIDPTEWRRRSLDTLRRTVVALAIVVIGLQWTNSRMTIVWQKLGLASPDVPTTYVAFYSMATGLHEGRIGQIDLAAMPLYGRPTQIGTSYERLPAGAEHRWVDFYTLDVGFSFIVEAARLLFHALPDNYLRVLALQLVVDATTVALVFLVFSEWHVTLGMLAAYLYSTNQVPYDLVAIPYYYYWDIPLTILVLGATLVAWRRPGVASGLLTVAALALGLGVWLRGSWWPLSLFLFVVWASSVRLRRKLLIPAVVFSLVAAPQVVRSSLAHGRPALTTRSVWHVALVGLGYYANPYGLTDNDETVFNLIKQKYGASLKYEDYFEHDQAAHKEFVAIWKNDPGFVSRSMLGRLRESLAGTTKTSVRSFLFLSNVTYRFLCLSGFVAMLWRGAEKRLIGIASAGVYAIYLALTCMFYFVGLAYDNVPEVALLVLFVGGIEAVAHLAGRLAGSGVAVWASSS